MESSRIKELLEASVTIAKDAGLKILNIYENEDFSKTIDFKADDSPLTIADKASHIIIAEALEKLAPDIPVMSEEGRAIEFEERKDWDYYWCVDPLDGTKEFINRNGEFTVNIALINKNRTVFGVIYAPVLDVSYYGIVGEGATIIRDGQQSELKVNNKTENQIAVRSKSHANPAEDELYKQFNIVDQISVGSSLKFCMVAEGKADIYYRHGPTMEWDTAAGQAIVEASGGVVLDADGNPFAYNKENLLNGSFLVKGF